MTKYTVKHLHAMYAKELEEAKKLPCILRPSDIYPEAVRTLPSDHIDHHGLGNGLDDLYLKVTPESVKIIFRVDDPGEIITVFTSQIDGSLWFDIPFAYPLTEITPERKLKILNKNYTTVENGLAYTKNIAVSEDGKAYGNAITKLAFLEEAISNGLRPRLPCKIGQKIYHVFEYYPSFGSPPSYDLEEIKVEYFIVKENDILLVSEGIEYSISKINKTLFFDKATAKRKCDELKEHYKNL